MRSFFYADVMIAAGHLASVTDVLLASGIGQSISIDYIYMLTGAVAKLEYSQFVHSLSVRINSNSLTTIFGTPLGDKRLNNQRQNLSWKLWSWRALISKTTL